MNSVIFQTMPWGDRSILKDAPRNKSNDGPILWIRPGEQSIPTGRNKWIFQWIKKGFVDWTSNFYNNYFLFVGITLTTLETLHA